MSRTDDLERIRRALAAAADAIRPFTPGEVEFERKSERLDPVTEADLAVDEVLRTSLPRSDEGWLSEETVDDRTRLKRRRVWVVDPLDGTREFVEGIPEWCISVGLLEDGEPVAGGILNPATGEEVVGAVGEGVALGSRIASPTGHVRLDGARVLASRSEVRRGEWARFREAGFEVVPCGSVAYKLGLVAAGRADATWTLVPKSEWDVVAGVALARAAGLQVLHADGAPPRFNQPDPLLPNLLAGPGPLLAEFLQTWVRSEPPSADD